MSNFQIREATQQDAVHILRFIRELAAYEKAEDQVTATVEQIARTLFGLSAKASALICSDDSGPIGFAVYFFNYSTWQAMPGLYLEDLYITPEKRSLGAGKAVLRHLARIAVENHCGRFEWSVLDWNRPAVEFYLSIGAEPLAQWVRYRLSGKTLKQFAAKG